MKTITPKNKKLFTIYFSVFLLLSFQNAMAMDVTEDTSRASSNSPHQSDPYLLYDLVEKSQWNKERNNDLTVLKEIKSLIDHGTDINAIHNGETLLDVAIRKSSYSIPLLISYGVLLDVTSADLSFTPLQGAAKYWNNEPEHQEYWNLLSSYIKAGSSSSITAAMNNHKWRNRLVSLRESITGQASYKEWLSDTRKLQQLFKEIEQASIANGIIPDKSIVDQETAFGETPLRVAISSNNSIAVSSLIKLGADVNKRNKYEITLLHLSVIHQHPEAIELLIKAGANPLTKGYSGDTAINIENNSNFYDMILYALSLLCHTQTYNHLSYQVAGYGCPDFLQKRSMLENFLSSCKEGSPYLEEPVSRNIMKTCIILMPTQTLNEFLGQRDPLLSGISETNHWFWETFPSVIHELPAKIVMQSVKYAITNNDDKLLKLIVDNTSITPDSDKAFATMLLESKHPEITRTLLIWGIYPDLNNSIGSRGCALGIKTDYECILSLPLSNAIFNGYLEKAKTLIKFGANPDHKAVRLLMKRQDITKDMTLLLRLYQRPEQNPDINHQPSPQEKKNIRLIKAVMNLDVFETAASLASGANPNTRLPCSADKCYAGLLGEALALERDVTKASISRLLLLYGASVTWILPFSTTEPSYSWWSLAYHKGKSLFAWSSWLQDKELATALEYFNPYTLKESETTASQVFSLLQRTAASAGVYLTKRPDILTETSVCLSLSPEIGGESQVWVDVDSTPPHSGGSACLDDTCSAVDSRSGKQSGYDGTLYWQQSEYEIFQPYCRMIDSQMSSLGKQVLKR